MRDGEISSCLHQIGSNGNRLCFLIYQLDEEINFILNCTVENEMEKLYERFLSLALALPISSSTTTISADSPEPQITADLLYTINENLILYRL